jgi:hypothetical protein
MHSTYSKPVAVTKSELWEYMEHLHQEQVYFQKITDETIATFTAVEISEKVYMESRGPFEADTDEDHNEFDKIQTEIDAYIAINVIKNLGFLDRHKVCFENWISVVNENTANGVEINTVADLLLSTAITEPCIIRIDGWFGDNVYYSQSFDNPRWIDVILSTELGIRDSSDTDHCFMESVVKTDEVKDGLPVYKVMLDS